MLPLWAKVDLKAMTIRIPQSSCITGTSPSDCLVSYTLVGGVFYPSAEVQLVYFTASVDWARGSVEYSFIFITPWSNLLLYTHLPYHNDSIIKMHAERRKRKTQEETTQDKDAWRQEDARRIKMHEGRHNKTSLQTYFTSHFICKGSKGLFKVCMWEDARDRT